MRTGVLRTVAVVYLLVSRDRPAHTDRIDCRRAGRAIMKRTPLRPSSRALPRRTALKPVGPATLKRTARYRTYLASPTWRRLRDAAKDRAGYRCDACSRLSVEGWRKVAQCPAPPWAYDAFTRCLHVHHKTYARFGGRERPADLVVLCDACHRQRHQGAGWTRRGPV